MTPAPGMRTANRQCSPANRALACLLAGLVALQPALSAAMIVPAAQSDALVVASLQDSLRSQSHSEGGHIGLGGTLGAASPDTVSVGINQADGQQDRHWVSEQTAILGTDSIRVRAQNTVLTGAVIAHAERAEDGTLIDRGHLDFRTGTLTATALQDTDSARSEGYSVATSISPRDFVGQPAQTPTGTTTLGLVATGHDRAQLNRATLGRTTCWGTDMVWQSSPLD